MNAPLTHVRTAGPVRILWVATCAPAGLATLVPTVKLISTIVHQVSQIKHKPSFYCRSSAWLAWSNVLKFCQTPVWTEDPVQMEWTHSVAAVCLASKGLTVLPRSMSVKAVLARTEALAQTTSTATHVPANQDSQAFSVRPTYQTALKGETMKSYKRK